MIAKLALVFGTWLPSLALGALLLLAKIAASLRGAAVEARRQRRQGAQINRETSDCAKRLREWL